VQLWDGPEGGLGRGAGSEGRDGVGVTGTEGADGLGVEGAGARTTVDTLGTFAGRGLGGGADSFCFFPLRSFAAAGGFAPVSVLFGVVEGALTGLGAGGGGDGAAGTEGVAAAPDSLAISLCHRALRASRCSTFLYPTSSRIETKSASRP